jgi:hypothetical protein
VVTILEKAAGDGFLIGDPEQAEIVEKSRR